MIYLHRTTTDASGRQSTLTASAECEAAALRLQARGYSRCTVGAWRAARQERDLADLTRIAIEDRRPLAKPAGALSVRTLARLSKDGNWY
jgi:hypothetical protein